MPESTTAKSEVAAQPHGGLVAGYEPVVDSTGDIPASPQRSFVGQALHDTFNQFGARFGSVWILLVALFAVIAPYIANSYPIVMKAKGEWSSPMFRSLSPTDLLLTAVALTVVVLWIRKVKSFNECAIVLLIVIAAVAPTVYIFKSVPETMSFEKYRDMERAGEVQFILHTIIPYSPTDRMRDMPERRLTAPIAAHRLGDVTLKDGETIFGIIEKQPQQIIVKSSGGERILDPADVASIVPKPAPISTWNWLGTEVDGADLLSRMIHAARIALSIGLVSTSIAVTIGITVGGLMGYFVGKVDLFGMRLIEIFEAIPQLLVLITVVAAWGQRSTMVIYVMMVTIGLLGWTPTARFIRAEFLRLRQQDFVQAAIAVGLPQRIVIYRHILPNGLTPVLVTATFSVASAILTEATLSFLGIGLIDEPSWGQMLNQARSGGQGFVWWMAIFPGLAIFLTVYAYALIGDAVRDAIDPKLRKRD